MCYKIGNKNMKDNLLQNFILCRKNVGLKLYFKFVGIVVFVLLDVGVGGGKVEQYIKSIFWDGGVCCLIFI